MMWGGYFAEKRSADADLASQVDWEVSVAEQQVDDALGMFDELDAAPFAERRLRHLASRRVEAAKPIQVDAWTRHRVIYEDPRLVQSEAVAWTDGAVLVRWQRNGHDCYMWVWSSAVQRRSD
ncbi:hypothetical protein ACFCVO_19585 [Agromyces sp. NPDC056379]|uniref:hypothetical protein n=1 Tax=unclassified Agromyces TaxID=2639701 RepID=UPI0035DB9D7D